MHNNIKEFYLIGSLQEVRWNSVNLSFGNPFGDHQSVGKLLVGYIGSRLFDIGAPSIYYEGCVLRTWTSLSVLERLHSLLLERDLCKSVCGSVTVIDLGISGSLRKVLQPIEKAQ